MENKKITIEKLKEISVSGLRFIDSICKENNLSYYIAYGTLIGTVRHKGFIPWDDDIDIWMKRADYDKFIKIVSKLNGNEWEILSYKNNGYYFSYAKLCNKKTEILPSRFFSNLVYGISIDIFPLELIEANSFEEANSVMKSINDMYNKKMNRIKALTGGKRDKKYILKKIYYEIAKIIFGDFKTFMMDLEKNINKEDGNYYICPFSPVPCVFEKNDINKSTISLFEGYEFAIPSAYDKILKNIYGEYMKLPPKEQQVTHHNFTAYYKEEK